MNRTEEDCVVCQGGVAEDLTETCPECYAQIIFEYHERRGFQ